MQHCFVGEGAAGGVVIGGMCHANREVVQVGTLGGDASSTSLSSLLETTGIGGYAVCFGTLGSVAWAEVC